MNIWLIVTLPYGVLHSQAHVDELAVVILGSAREAWRLRVSWPEIWRVRGRTPTAHRRAEVIRVAAARPHRENGRKAKTALRLGYEDFRRAVYRFD